METKTVVIIGGGIAGTTCAEYILQFAENKVNVIIVTPKDVIKTAVTKNNITKTLTEIGMKELSKTAYENQMSNVTIIVGYLQKLDVEKKILLLEDRNVVKYDRVCICTGGKPVTIKDNDPFVICIRDTDTVNDLKKRLSKAKKIIVVGNGGIALELVYEIIGCEVIWCIKDESIGNSFFDEGAAQFLISTLEKGKDNSSINQRKANQTIFKRKRFETEKEKLKSDFIGDSHGAALGPDWSCNQQLKGSNSNCTERHVTVKYSCSVVDIFHKEGDKSDVENVYLKLSNGEILGADFIVSATGVRSNVPFEVIGSNELDMVKDAGIQVSDNMQTSLKNVYACGDVCSPKWEHSETWLPMKLWTQAWQMGAYAGKCIANDLNGGDNLLLDICFELFSHLTTFFGYKICLLGCYNGQKMKTSEYEVLLRFTPGVEYVKVILKNGRVKGCLLIGETDLEETFENLILNELDVGYLGDSLLSPDVDIEDYFD